MTRGRSSLAAASCVAAVLCLLLQADASSQAGPLAGFDADTAKAVQDWRTPGLAIAVVKDGQVVFGKGYGVRELGKPQPVDTHTLFAIGSTTKAMTAALVGMLVDEKKLGWDDPVVKQLPWFQVKDPYLTWQITVRDLLTHHAGLGKTGRASPQRTPRPRGKDLGQSWIFLSDF
jgi:CubicO group peptidase (beta-lactamase class C family)